MTDIDDIHHPIGFRNAHDGRRDPGDELHPRPAGLRDAVDRWGPDPGLWPDAAMAQRARAALLSDRAFRAYRDDAVVLDERLEVAAAALDSRIEAGPLARIRAGVMAQIAPQPVRWARRLAAAAAVVLVAGALGGASSLFLLPADDDIRVASTVQLDPLLFGPSELGF